MKRAVSAAATIFTIESLRIRLLLAREVINVFCRADATVVSLGLAADTKDCVGPPEVSADKDSMRGARRRRIQKASRDDGRR
jgi:hypothetical protein